MQRLMDLIEDNKTKMPDGLYKELIEAYGKARHGAGEHTEKEWFKIWYHHVEYPIGWVHPVGGEEELSYREVRHNRDAIVCFDAGREGRKKLDYLLGEPIEIQDCRVLGRPQVMHLTEETVHLDDPKEIGLSEISVTYYPNRLFRWEAIEHDKL